jgi:hypothetical protein
MRGIVKINDGSVVHVIPRAEVRHAEVVALGDDDWALKYQLACTVIIRAVEWKGESRPETLKTKIEIGAYNRLAAGSVLTMITSGHRDSHLERRSDNVFMVRSGLVEDDARVVLCRQFVAEMVTRLDFKKEFDEDRRKLLHEIRAAAQDLVLPDWYPLQEESR